MFSAFSNWTDKLSMFWRVTRNSKVQLLMADFFHFSRQRSSISILDSLYKHFRCLISRTDVHLIKKLFIMWQRKIKTNL